MHNIKKLPRRQEWNMKMLSMAHCVLLLIFGAEPHKTARRMVHEFKRKPDTSTQTWTLIRSFHRTRYNHPTIRFLIQCSPIPMTWTWPPTSLQCPLQECVKQYLCHPTNKVPVSYLTHKICACYLTGVPFTVLKYPEMNTITVHLWTQCHTECASFAAISGADGGILEFLRDEVRCACDGSQEMSGWVVGGHYTAPRKANGNNGVQREIIIEISSGIFTERWYGAALASRRKCRLRRVGAGGRQVGDHREYRLVKCDAV